MAGRMYALTTVVLVRSYSLISGSTSHDTLNSSDGKFACSSALAASSWAGLM
ncbi:hypothetical protein D3C85_1502420 [compost metagenome]